VGGIRFYKPISIGEVIKIEATVVYTRKTSIHIAVDVYSRNFSTQKFEKKTHCVIVFVSVDENGKPLEVKKWIPKTDAQKKMEEYAIKLNALRKQISDEMMPFVSV
jgi:acyl-CoA hydrolase